MIIGIETSASGNKVTGTSRYINCLLEQLNTLDGEVKTFSAFQALSENKLSFIKKRGLQKFIYREFFLPEEMEDENIDLAFFPDYFMPRNFNKPSAIIIHDLSFITHPQLYSKKFVSFYKYQLKNTLKKNPLIVTISGHSRNQISKHLYIKKENIFLLQGYSAFNSDKNLRRRIDEDDYLLFVGHLEPRKNLSFLIKNFLKWKESRKINIKLKIAGELWIKNFETVMMLNDYSNHPDIEFTGYIEEKNMDELYRNASGFVHTSFEEGFCLPVLEAMNYGLPIICSSNTGSEEISKPHSININPSDDLSLIKGFDELFSIISDKKKINYNIKYSPQLMKSQMNIIIDILRAKVNNKIFSFIPKAVKPEEALEKTLVYSSLFNSGIKKEDIIKSIFDIKVNSSEVEIMLLKLFAEDKIYFKDDVVFLKIAQLHFYKNNGKKLKQAKIKRSLSLLNFIPFIASISFSGGTAHYGLEDHDDLDLFIIAKPNTIYIVYSAIHILSLLFRLRKELCANYLIDETVMEIKSPRDFYTSHQIISLIPYKNENMLNIFHKNNKWVNEFFPNFNCVSPDQELSNSNFYFLLKPINKLIKSFYRLIYKKQILKQSGNGSLKLEDHCIKLYTNDNREKIIKEFEEVWNKYRMKKYLSDYQEEYSNQLLEKTAVV